MDGWTGGMESRGGIRTDLELQWLGRLVGLARVAGWEPLRIPIWVERFGPSPACFSRSPPDPDKMGRKVEGGMAWKGCRLRQSRLLARATESELLIAPRPFPLIFLAGLS